MNQMFQIGSFRRNIIENSPNLLILDGSFSEDMITTGMSLRDLDSCKFSEPLYSDMCTVINQIKGTSCKVVDLHLTHSVPIEDNALELRHHIVADLLNDTKGDGSWEHI